MTESRFAHRNVIVTGAGSGIGRATSVRLGAEGAGVLCLDVSLERAAETAALITGAGGRAVAARADVRSRDEVRAAVELAEKELGAISLLVNNAGVVTMDGLDELTDEAWDFVIDVNLKGQFIVSQLVAPAIERAGGGAIVNLSTIEAEVVVASGPHCQPHYNASKGGVKMLTKALAHELSSRGIRVNAVAPVPCATGFAGLDLTTPEALEFFRPRMMIPRAARPAEIAAAICFLLSDDASFITGTQLAVDGGWLAY